MRTLVIGDIHSGLKALKQVLEKAKVTPENKLIFLGDYVDGWSDAVPTIDFLLELDKTHNCLFLKGNHDELCHDWLVTREDNLVWFKHGGKASMESYKKASKDTIKKHLNFYEGLKVNYLDSDNRLFVHAGFTHLKGIDFEYFTKSFYWDRTLWELALAVNVNPELKKDHRYYPKRLLNYKEIYIGHTPVTRMNRTTPQKAANVWNIDTGAAFKGPLTILNVETKQFWQSNPVFTHYPNEKGRN